MNKLQIPLAKLDPRMGNSELYAFISRTAHDHTDHTDHADHTDHNDHIYNTDSPTIST
jgi:hypothetical protein